MDIRNAQEISSRKPTESVNTKAESITNNRQHVFDTYAKESHSDLYQRYDTALKNGDTNELQKLDIELAERLILDNPATSRISYGTDKARAELSLQRIQEQFRYKNNVELREVNGERIISHVQGVGQLGNLTNMLRAQELRLNLTVAKQREQLISQIENSIPTNMEKQAFDQFDNIFTPE
jgi:hypothetical protein